MPEPSLVDKLLEARGLLMKADDVLAQAGEYETADDHLLTEYTIICLTISRAKSKLDGLIEDLTGERIHGCN